MNSELRCVLCVALLCRSTSMSAAVAADRVSPSDSTDTKISVVPEPTESPRYLHDEHQTTQASMMIGGPSMGYQAEAGILVVHVKDPMDDDAPLPKEERTGPPPPQPVEASMSYVAYFKGDKEDPHRPITFLFNGSPGSSTVWLQMHFYTSGQMVYAHEPDLQALHAKVAAFIEKTKNGGVSR